ncbi:hypothetical protein D3C85_805240 [compost metagenome]
MDVGKCLALGIKLIEARAGSDPDPAFIIFQYAINQIACYTIRILLVVAVSFYISCGGI